MIHTSNGIDGHSLTHSALYRLLYLMIQWLWRFSNPDTTAKITPIYNLLFDNNLPSYWTEKGLLQLNELHLDIVQVTHQETDKITNINIEHQHHVDNGGQALPD